MKSALLDTNVLLDVIADRHPHYEASAAIWTLADTGQLPGFVSAISFNNIHYLIRRHGTAEKARKALLALRDSFRIVPLDEQLLGQAIDAKMADFEDAIQFYSALRCGAECIVSRNAKDFPKNSPIAILSPEDFLAVRQSQPT